MPTDGTHHQREGVMTTTSNSASRIYSLIGVGVGLAAFLAVGLLPSILYGGYAGVMLAGGIFGTPVDASMAVRALIVAGMVLGRGRRGGRVCGRGPDPRQPQGRRGRGAGRGQAPQVVGPHRRTGSPAAAPW
jgi:hypothetical protein